MLSNERTYIQIMQRRSPHHDFPSTAYNYWWEVHRGKYSYGPNGDYNLARALELATARIARFKERDAVNIAMFANSETVSPAYYRFDYKTIKVTETIVTEELGIFEAENLAHETV
jgi:hypothetical protein